MSTKRHVLALDTDTPLGRVPKTGSGVYRMPVTLDDTVGDEEAFELAYITNKPAGSDVGFLIAKTNTLTQGVGKPIKITVDGVTIFYVDDDGNLFSLGTVNDGQSKLDGTAPPAVTNDTTEGYVIGSLWIDVTNDETYTCVDITVNAAVWMHTSYKLATVLEDLNALGAASSDGEFIVATGAGAFAYESTTVARTSLGIGEGDSPQLAGLNVGHASDSLLTRVSAGLIAVAGITVAMAGGAYHDGFSDFVADEHLPSSTFATAAQGTLADSAIQQAALDAAVAGLYDHKGAYNASTNSPDLDTTPSGIKKADAYTVSVAGTFYAVAMEAGDVLIADQDNPTQSSHWTIVNRNIDSSAFATAGHTILSHDTDTTGAELTALADNSIANALHRHSKLVASDGSPDPALSMDSAGDASFVGQVYILTKGLTLKSPIAGGNRYGLKYGTAGLVDNSDLLMLTNREQNGELAFATDDGTGGASGETERVRIDTSGNVNIKTGNLIIGTAGKGIELGHATDTTLTRVSAGVVAVEGINLIKADTTNYVTLTDNSIANALHRHSELVASDGSPDPAVSVDAAGNVGFSVNPHSGWNSSFSILQTSLRGSINSTSASIALSSNVYFDGAWKYITTARAGNYFIESGTAKIHNWRVAVSGAANAEVTWISVLSIDEGGDVEVEVGNLIIGTAGKGIELGHATDTTLTRVSAGVVAVEGVTIALLGTANEYTKTQNFNATTLSDGVNISWDVSSNQVCKVTLAGNRTLNNPTNMKAGATYVLRIIQDGTGSRTLAYGAAYKWPGGSAPTLTTSAGAIDIITFVSDGTSMFGVISQAFA